jgi:RHS repeat-associated protein
MQSGTWAKDAVGTTFHPRFLAHLTKNMAGWVLQPDINQQVFVPIRSVDVGQSTITLAGGYAGLGTAGTRFRIYAPPGVQRRSYSAGAHSRPVASAQTRHLYMGYRYESPMAGRMENAAPEVAQTKGRQEGKNFTGLYYTLHRHYDPFLMRFTSPDPIASPFYNLFHYAGNNPAGYFDPDGLERKRRRMETGGEWLFRKLYEWERDGGGVKEVAVGGLYGLLNLATLGIFGMAVDAEDFANTFGANANTVAFQFGAIGTEVVGLVALTVATGGAGGALLAGRMATMGGRAIAAAARGTAAVARKAAGFIGRTGGAAVGQTSRTARAAHTMCFVAGTDVLAADASGSAVAKAIEDIEVGDLVWARNEFTGEEGFKPVVRLFRNTADTVVHLSYRRDPGSARRGASGLKGGGAEDGDDLSATITGTDEHPFWSLCHSEFECFSSDSATTPIAAPINSTTASIACIDVASPSMAIPAARPIPIPPSDAACRKRAGLNQPGLAAARAKKAAMPSSSPP